MDRIATFDISEFTDEFRHAVRSEDRVYGRTQVVEEIQQMVEINLGMSNISLIEFFGKYNHSSRVVRERLSYVHSLIQDTLFYGIGLSNALGLRTSVHSFKDEIEIQYRVFDKDKAADDAERIHPDTNLFHWLRLREKDHPTPAEVRKMLDEYNRETGSRYMLQDIFL